METKSPFRYVSLPLPIVTLQPEADHPKNPQPRQEKSGKVTLFSEVSYRSFGYCSLSNGFCEAARRSNESLVKIDSPPFHQLHAFTQFAKNRMWPESSQSVRPSSTENQFGFAIYVFGFKEILCQNGWNAVHIATIDRRPLENLQDFADIAPHLN